MGRKRAIGRASSFGAFLTDGGHTGEPPRGELLLGETDEAFVRGEARKVRCGLRDDLHVGVEALESLAHHDVALPYARVETAGDAAEQERIGMEAVDEELGRRGGVDCPHATTARDETNAVELANRIVDACLGDGRLSPELEEERGLLPQRAEHGNRHRHGFSFVRGRLVPVYPTDLLTVAIEPSRCHRG